MNESPTLSASDQAPSGAASKDIISQSEIEKLLAQVESVDTTPPGGEAGDPQPPIQRAGRDIVRRHDFPKLSLISSDDLRPLRVRHEDFIAALATRLSIHLGLEVTLQMTKLEAISFQQFADGLSNPTYLTLLKLQPLAGICLLDIPQRLGLCIDRKSVV